MIWRTNNIGGCSGGSDMKSTTITDGSTSYDIMGLEEDSSYTITVIASNSVGSAVSNMETVATLVAGGRLVIASGHVAFLYSQLHLLLPLL